MNENAPDTHLSASVALATVMGMRLRRLNSLFVQHWGHWFRRKAVEVSPVQGGLLLLIRENPGLPQIAFARLLGVEPPTLAQTLAPLVQAGLVHRYRAETDGRAVALHLSREGMAAAAAVETGHREHEAHLLNALTPEERRTLLELLDKAVSGAERACADAAAMAEARSNINDQTNDQRVK